MVLLACEKSIITFLMASTSAEVNGGSALLTTGRSESQNNQ